MGKVLDAMAVLVLAAGPLIACDAVSSEALDEPRLLAIQVEPPALVAGGTHTLTALAFDVAGPIGWSACPTAWTATEPPACPGGAAIDLGQGNPITVTMPQGVESLWLRADATGALTAVKRVAADGPEANPRLDAILTSEGAELPAAVGVGAVLGLRARLDDTVDPTQVVISWYTTAGKIEPLRTLGSASADFTAPDAPASARLIAVCRDTEGGTCWAQATLEVTP